MPGPAEIAAVPGLPQANKEIRFRVVVLAIGSFLLDTVGTRPRSPFHAMERRVMLLP